jgi:hypothetical protein
VLSRAWRCQQTQPTPRVRVAWLGATVGTRFHRAPGSGQIRVPGRTRPLIKDALAGAPCGRVRRLRPARDPTDYFRRPLEGRPAQSRILPPVASTIASSKTWLGRRMACHC